MKILALTYTPIIMEKRTYQNAIQQYSETKPFHDGSIRPTPSFDKSLPGISSMCRKEMLVNQVEAGDIILYFTNAKDYECEKHKSIGRNHSRLTAILKVEKIFKGTNSIHAHQQANEYYENKGIESPNNCLAGNNILPRKKGCGIIGQNQTYQSTINGYNARVKDCETFVVTSYIYSNFTTPVPFLKEDYEKILNRKLKKNSPFNQRYIKLEPKQYEAILDHIKSFGEHV